MASQMADIINQYRQTMPSGGLERGVQGFFQAKAMGEESKLRKKQIETEEIKQTIEKQKALQTKLFGPIAAADTPEKWLSGQKSGFIPKEMEFGTREPFIMGVLQENAFKTVEVGDPTSPTGTRRVPEFKAVGEAGKPKEGESSFDQEAKLRSGFENQTKDFVKIRDAYGRITASATDPSPAGDLALIFNYMKVLDPGSTVREGEFATAQNAGGMDSTIRNMYNRVVSGERLNEKQRADFVGRAGKLYGSQLKGLESLEKDYTKKAERYGLNPENIITDYRVNYEQQQAQQPQGTPALTNQQGWPLLQDAQGNKAYVGPNGEIEEVR